MMMGIFSELLSGILEQALTQFDNIMLNIIEFMMNIEKMMNVLFPTYAVDKAYQFVYLFSATLLILKFLKKGFSVYILWRDGDADSSPQDMVIGTVEAVVVMIGFPMMYDILAEVTIWFTKNIMTCFSLSTDGALSILIKTLAQLGIPQLIMLIIYVVMVIVLFIKLLQRGVELLILRLGIPFACLGLIDSDMGAFKPYIQNLFKCMFTSVIQVCLMSLSLRCMLNVSVYSFTTSCLGIALITTAFSTPALLQNMLVGSGASLNLTNKIYSGARFAQTVKGFMGK